MALTLEGATFGYDAQGLAALKRHLKINCIGLAETTLKKGINEIEQKVDASWVGTSAKKYKNKFDTDVKTTITKLKDLGDKIEAELDTAGQGMINVDESIEF